MLTYDCSPLAAALNEAKSFVDTVPNFAVRMRDLLKSDDPYWTAGGATKRADGWHASLQPSNRFRELLAAARAGNVERIVVD